MNELKDLPNTPGFRFSGVLHSGDRVPCIVMRDYDGLCRVGGAARSCDLSGWESHGETQERWQKIVKKAKEKQEPENVLF
jgi:hypothetical protein